MNYRKLQLYIFLFIGINLQAQEADSEAGGPERPDLPVKEKDSAAAVTQEVITHWTKKNAVGTNFSEVAFLNWNSGGNNSVSALFYGKFERKYQRKLLSWKSDASLRYGINAQQGRELRKTDDEFRVSSTLGYRNDSLSNFRYSAKFNFNTQFAAGYRYPNTERAISQFMAPGYLFLGVGSEYSAPNEDLTVYFSPLTKKTTFVLNNFLANQGRFGVTPAIRDEEGNVLKQGERVRMEIGILLTNGYKKEIFENVNLESQLSLYTDYINRFGNIDVDWQLGVDMKVNDFIKANVGTHIIYDDDVKIKKDVTGDGELEELGPRIQLKQILGIGVVYNF